MREALETPGRTAALVTPDRNLARRVAAEMARWDIAIDDSAGRPLAHTAAGAFLCLLAEAAEARFAPVPLLALLKHPFAHAAARTARAFRARARELDRWCLRGPRPDPGLAGIAQRHRQSAAGTTFPPPAEALAALTALVERDRRHPGAAGSSCSRKHEAPLPDSARQRMSRRRKRWPATRRENCILWANGDGEAAAELVRRACRTARKTCRPSSPAPMPPCSAAWR